MTTHFLTFTGNAVATVQADSASKSCCSSLTSSRDFISLYTFRSSANSKQYDPKIRGRSFMEMMNNNSTDSCGKSLETVPQIEKPNSTRTRWQCPVTNHSIQASRPIPRPAFFSCPRRHAWFTSSKALKKSTNTTSVGIQESEAAHMRSKQRTNFTDMTDAGGYVHVNYPVNWMYIWSTIFSKWIYTLCSKKARDFPRIVGSLI